MEKNESLNPNKVIPERIWHHHRTLCRDIGHRLLGTENDRRAAEYIESHFKRCGWVTDIQKFNCPSWDHFNTIIHTGSGYEITPPEGGACMFSLPCDVTGETVNVRTFDELAKADIKGKICVISGELRDDNIRSDRSPILLMIEEKGPLAVIVIDKHVEKGFQTKVIRDPKFKIPVCAVSRNSGARLLADGGMVTVKIESKRYDSYSTNIFASNTGNSNKRICVTAHYDTSSDTPGALDNGSGISIILEVAEALKERGCTIPVEFIAFGGEEYALLGSNEYMRAYPERIDSTELNINVDAVGINGISQIYMSGYDERLNSIVRKQVERVGGYHEIITDRMNMSGDHALFFNRNIKTMLLADMPGSLVFDTNLDIPRNICMERLEDAANIVLECIMEYGTT